MPHLSPSRARRGTLAIPVLEPENYLPIIEQTPVGIVVWKLVDESDDEALVMQLANPAASRFTGIENVASRVGMRIREAFPHVQPERPRMYADVVRTGQGFEETFESKVAGRPETLYVRASKLGQSCVLVTFENLTQQRRASAFLDSILESLPCMVFVKDAQELRFERINRAGEELLGLSRDQLLGKNDYDFFPREQADFFTAKDRETLEKREVEDIPEEPINTAKGQRWLHTKKVPVLDLDGRPLHLLGISMDITEARRVHAALEVAMKELETFSYSVAHDLRAPLRAIDGFSQAIAEDPGSKLDAGGLDSLERIRRAARRMSELIDDLLELSRLTRAPMLVSKVDVTSLVRDVIADLRTTAGSRDVETVVQEGMTADADPRLLLIVFENLLGNAFKFSSKREKARIEVGFEDNAFFVRDDGAGFDPAHAAKMFSAFVRLHDQQVFDGTGIGLAIVARIIARHGGRVWAESEVDKGATFRFTLGRS